MAGKPKKPVATKSAPTSTSVSKKTKEEPVKNKSKAAPVVTKPAPQVNKAK
jgi:hypothetical protein